MTDSKILFPFIYHPDRSLAVYEESKRYLGLEGREGRISELGWAYHDVGDLIPHTERSLGSGHFFPWLESWDELQVSCTLCMLGLYKQAMVSMRIGLELGLLSVYWNLNDDGHSTLKAWLRSRENTPRFGEIWKKLIKHPNFKRFSEHHDLRGRLLSLGYLHDFVHTKGHKFSNSMGLLKANFQTFEEEAFRAWLASFEEVVKVLAICHLVKYPLGVMRVDYHSKFGLDTPMFGGLDEHQVDRLEALVGQEIFHQLVELGEADSRVASVLEWVSKLPDLTEEDFEAQSMAFDMDMIEMSGIERWLENQLALRPAIKDQSKFDSRIEALTCWAKAKGFDKPRWARLSEEKTG